MSLKLSFCITCKNRLHQIKQTLRKNLADNANLYKDIEFVLVDFGSEDNLKAWILSDFKNELASGYLKYFYTDELTKWHCSIAKNTAHMLATGSILVNLDCDNFTGENGAKYVIDQFEIYGERLVLHQSSGIPQDGSFGRISVLKKFFHVIGGYDESFHEMGFQDTDLIHRLVKFGLRYVPKGLREYNEAIPNSKEESIKFTYSSKSYSEMNLENEEFSKNNISKNILKANRGKIGLNMVKREGWYKNY